MSSVVTENLKIIDILKSIKNGEYVMPAFQREYVWELSRIEKLWDSILQGYPFSTFLFWELDQDHITDSNLFYLFPQDCSFKKNGDNKGCCFDPGSINFSLPNHPTIAVLDGQQRLTSLYLSLFGSMYKEPRKNSSKYPIELYIELDESKIDEINAFNTKKYNVYFSENSLQSVSKFKIKDLLNPEFEDPDTRIIKIEQVVERLPARQKEYGKNILNRLCSALYDEKLICYTKISELYQNDALEMFVRFNSGGKNLKVSEISMSILEINWPNVKKDFNSVLVGDYENFGTEFILRTGHMIYGDVLSSNIDVNFAIAFKEDFAKFKKALEKTAELFEVMHYNISRFRSKWNVVIPVIYIVYHNLENETYIDSLKGIAAYLFRSILFQFYASGTTSKLKILKDLIYENNYCLSPESLDTIFELTVTQSRIEDLFLARKGTPLMANLFYCLNINDINEDYDYDEDHVHCRARFDRAKPLNMQMSQWDIACSNKDTLINLQLLESSENRSKGDQDLNVYLSNLPQAKKELIMKQGFIPAPSNGMSEFQYYSIDNCKQFYEDRKKLLTDKLSDLLNGNF